jgi:ABC-type Fe3+/spermidine/putrescine transport system ATPase subunit
MSEKKITKKDMYNGIIATLTENFGDEVQKYVAFLEGEVAALDKRAEKEKERRAAKKAENDELKDAVKAAIGAEAVTAQEIADALVENFEDVTKAKVTYRASQLVKDGEIYKVTVKTEDGRKVVAYTTEAPAEDAE